MTYTVDEQRERTASALRAIREDVGLTQSELAARMGKSSAAISAAETTNGIDSLKIMRAYEESMQVPFGTILMRAGLIDMPSSAQEAIKADAELGQDAKFFLLKAYALASTG